MVHLDDEAVEDALEELEGAMSAHERTLSHDDVRPSSVISADKARSAYRTLVKAHPEYELTKDEPEKDA